MESILSIIRLRTNHLYYTFAAYNDFNIIVNLKSPEETAIYYHVRVVIGASVARLA